MKCKAAHYYIQLELDGELPAGNAASLADHLNGCPACTQVRRQLWALRSAMRELTEISGGEPAIQESRVWRRAPHARRSAWVAGLAAAAAIAIVIGIWFARLPGQNGPPRPAIVEGPAPSEEYGTAVIPPATSEPRLEPPANPRPLVHVEFGSPEHFIAVPCETRNPNVTIIWLYPAVRGEQAVGTPEKQSPPAKGAPS